MERKATWNGCHIDLHRGDITDLAVDAVVNAANPWLAGGGGVDGAIHRRGGPAILEECRAAIAARGGKPLEAGEAVITTGGRLPAKRVIHTVGPVYSAETAAEDEARLAACYRTSLALARQHGLRSVAFPCVSTGAYGYPPAAACRTAVAAVRDDLLRHGGLDRVVFCTFAAGDFALYEKELGSFSEPRPSGSG